MAKANRKRRTLETGTPIYRHDGAAVVGRVEGDTFYKSARSTVHLLRRPRAWACDLDALDQARAAGAAWVELFDRDPGTTYRAALVEFYRRGLRIDRGHGVQMALPLAAWEIVGRASTARPAGNQSAAGGPVQMRLIA